MLFPNTTHAYCGELLWPPPSGKHTTPLFSGSEPCLSCVSRGTRGNKGPAEPRTLDILCSHYNLITTCTWSGPCQMLSLLALLTSSLPALLPRCLLCPSKTGIIMCQILTKYQTLGQAAAPLQIGKLRLEKGKLWDQAGLGMCLCLPVWKNQGHPHPIAHGDDSSRSPVGRTSRTDPDPRFLSGKLSGCSAGVEGTPLTQTSDISAPL